MTGERTPTRALARLQPGGRRPAPGELALVQAFLNSQFDLETTPGAELFATPSSLRGWLLRAGLIKPHDLVGFGDLERARRLRDGLRRLVGAARPLTPASAAAPAVRDALADLNAAAWGATAEVRFTTAGARFVVPADGGVAGALGLVLSVVAGAMIDGSWGRLKICPGQDCGWAFYDHSRNRTGRWCSMSVCGGRAKAREHYRRSRESR